MKREFTCPVHGSFKAEPDAMAPHEKKCKRWVSPTVYCGRYALATDADDNERFAYEYVERLWRRLP